jgi:hypothetical protein
MMIKYKRCRRTRGGRKRKEKMGQRRQTKLSGKKKKVVKAASPFKTLDDIHVLLSKYVFNRILQTGPVTLDLAVPNTFLRLCCSQAIQIWQKKKKRGREGQEREKNK